MVKVLDIALARPPLKISTPMAMAASVRKSSAPSTNVGRNGAPKQIVDVAAPVARKGIADLKEVMVRKEIVDPEARKALDTLNRAPMPRPLLNSF